MLRISDPAVGQLLLAIALAGELLSIKAHAVTLTGESHFHQCYKLNLTFDTCREFTNLLLLLTRSSSNRMSHNFVQKDVNLTFSSEKLNYVTFSYLKVTLSSKVK